MLTWPTKQRKPVVDVQPERDIFEFWDGNQTRRVDPLPIWHTIWQTEDIEGLLKRAGDSREAEAVVELTQLARMWFCVPPYQDGVGGLTELEAERLLDRFFAYCMELKKKHGPLPMPWRIQANWISSAQSTTPPAADSSSSPSESPVDEPSTASTPSPLLSTTA
jgi:hypothetical protein